MYNSEIVKRFLPFFLIFTAVLLLYHPAFGVYFSHDDFFSFKVSQTNGSLRDFLNLFSFHSFEDRGIAFYRPLFREAYFNIYYSLFGLNHYPARLFSFLLHFSNIFLVYTFANNFLKNHLTAQLSALFFGISAANVAILYYLTGGIQVQGATLFSLLCLIFFYKFLENGKVYAKRLAFVFFLFGLASHELSTVLPAILLGLTFVKYPIFKFLKSASTLWLFFAILIPYFYLEIFIIGYSSGEEQYKLVFSLKNLINSYSWYTVWALGLPEMLIDWVRPGLKLNPSLLKYWSDYYYVIFPTFFLGLLSLMFSSLYLLFVDKKEIINKQNIFLAFWFIVGLTPVIFFPSHKSTYYLGTVLPAFWILLCSIVVNYYELRSKASLTALLLPLSFIVSVFLLSLTSARLGEQTYLASQRGKIALKLINDFKSKYPSLERGSIIYFKNDPTYPFVSKEWGGTSKQAAFVLNNADALQLFYKDPTVKVFYEDLGGVPEEFSRDEVIEIIAKINT